jgi:hypothetical protein
MVLLPFHLTKKEKGESVTAFIKDWLTYLNHLRMSVLPRQVQGVYIPYLDLYNGFMQIQERYGKLEEHDRSFDKRFWQEAGPKAIFDAAYDMIKDYLLLKTGHADEPRLQRSVESFHKAN